MAKKIVRKPLDDAVRRRVEGKIKRASELPQNQNYRNLPMNTIFTAHVRAREVGDEEEDTTIVRGPEVSPSIAKHLQGAVGTIGYMVKREVTVRSKKNKDKIFTQIRRRLLVGDSEHYITKDRNGLFGDFIDAPDLGEMIEAIYSA
jgi:hypothetical protein